MENNKYKANIKSLCENFCRELIECGLFEEEYIKAKQKQIDEKAMSLLRDEKPKIMVYGIYNSGKSTLVNAICRKAVARVADRPMTDCITEYDAGKYTLVDSPGVNAPMQHEEIADRHLEGCHMILFVISSKGIFEDRVNYQKMGDLIQKGLPFYIVLNERADSLPPKEKVRERKEAEENFEEGIKSIERKIIKNLRTYSGVPDVEEKYEVIKVNAQRAWKGIEQQKQPLIDKSKISVLLRRIDYILEGRGALKQFLSPLSAMEQIIGEAEKDVIVGMGNEDYAVRREILQAKAMNFRESFLGGIRDIVGRHFDVLYNRMLGNTGVGMGRIQDEICRDVEMNYKSKVSSLVRYLRESFPEISFEVGNACSLEKMTIQMGDEPINWEENAKPYNETEGLYINKKRESTDASQDISKAVRDINHFINPVNPIDPLSIGVFVLNTVFDFFKSKKKAEEEEQALRAEIEKNNREAKERVEEDIRKRKEARSYANAKIDEMASEIRTRLQDSMDKEFGRMVDLLDQTIEEKNRKDTAASQFMDRCKEFRREISEIRKEIG